MELGAAIEGVRFKVTRAVSKEVEPGTFYECLVGEEKARVEAVVEIMNGFPLNHGEKIWVTAGGSLADGKKSGTDIDLAVYVKGVGITNRLWQYTEEQLSRRRLAFVEGESPVGKMGGETRPVIWQPLPEDRLFSRLGERSIHLIMPYSGDSDVDGAKWEHRHGMAKSHWFTLVDRVEA